MTQNIEPIVVGTAIGIVFRSALASSRWFASLFFSTAAITVTVVLFKHGLDGIEVYGSLFFAEVLRHVPLVLGAAVGVVGAGTFFRNAR